MSDFFTPGTQHPVKFQVVTPGYASLGTTTQSGPVTLLNVLEHSLEIFRMLFDVTHTGHGGDTARISGKRDWSGTIELGFDADAPPYLNPPLLLDGTYGVFLFFYSPLSLNRPIQVPGIIEKERYRTGADNWSRIGVDAKCSKLAGSFVYPTQ